MECAEPSLCPRECEVGFMLSSWILWGNNILQEVILGRDAMLGDAHFWPGSAMEQKLFLSNLQQEWATIVEGGVPEKGEPPFQPQNRSQQFEWVKKCKLSGSLCSLVLKSRRIFRACVAPGLGLRLEEVEGRLVLGTANSCAVLCGVWWGQALSSLVSLWGHGLLCEACALCTCLGKMLIFPVFISALFQSCLSPPQ